MTLGRGFTGNTLTEAEAVRHKLGARHVPGFSDEVGDRVLILNDRKVPSLELLRFRKALTATAGFEVALRRRVERLRQFRDPSFAPVPAVEYVGDGLILLAAHTPGRRLSEILEQARDPSFAVGLIRQLTPALAALHHHDGDGIGHGALTASRIRIAPQGRLLITEHVLGTALERLQLSAARMHAELGIALPPTATGIRPRPDGQTDLFQLGLIALALLLGRSLSRTEYPPRTSEALDEVAETVAPDFEDGFARLRPWLERALRIDRKSFASPEEAVEALHDLPAIDVDGMAAQWIGLIGTAAPPPEDIASSPVPEEPDATPHDLDVPPHVASDPVLNGDNTEPEMPAIETGPAADSTPVVFLTPEPETPEPAAPLLENIPDPMTDLAAESVNPPADGQREALWPEVERMNPSFPRMQRLSWVRSPKTKSYVRWAIAGLAVCALVEALIIASLLRRGMSAAPPAQLAEIKVETPEPGASVVVDGTTAGVTPLNLKIGPEVRSLSVVVPPSPAAKAESTVGSTGLDHPAARGSEAAAKARAAGPVAITPPPQRSGGIRLVSPIELEVFEGDARLGSSATGIVSAAAGRRELELVNSALGYRSRQVVDVKAGQVVALTVAPPNGRININALPWAEVWIDGKPVGETPIGNFALPLGDHEIVFRHPQLAEQRRRVVVRFDTVARISVNLER